MSNLELCDTLYYKRNTNQTPAAIGAQFNHRRLSKSWCYHETNELYVSRLFDWTSNLADNKKTNNDIQEVTTLPAKI